MARARNIKPGFFTNDELGEVSPLGRLLFIGLWCVADRAGRLVDRPKKIKAELLPYDDCNADELLEELELHGFITRYGDDKNKFIQVTNFCKHQNPHVKEQESEIPAPYMPGASMVQELDKNNESTEVAGLIPDSLLLIPDSLNRIPDPLPCAEQAQSRETEIQAKCRETWGAYSKAYFSRYGTEPVRNQKINSQIKQIVERLGKEAPLVAEFYVTHNDNFYVRKLHEIGLLLANAENLRTQWAVGWAQMTSGKARQIEQSSNSISAIDEAMAIYEGMQNAGSN